MPDPVRITFLGGLGEIGRNCAAFEQDGRILLLDCGLMFPDAEMLGIDLVLPDFTWLRENAWRIEEAGLLGRTELITVVDGERRRIGPFDCEFIAVTHSVPHGFATAFHTPQGVILHSGDFKLDLPPVDGRITDLARIGALASDPGIKLLLSDSTNAEEAGFTASESSVGEVLADLMRDHPDKRVIVTCFASHIHRIQQV